jgi:hypothetical protein
MSSNQTLELLKSASNGYVTSVQQLLDNGVPWDAATPGGYTALQAACMCGQHQVVWLLLQHHQRRKQQGNSCCSLRLLLPRCIAAAASMGHANTIRIIAACFDFRWLDMQPCHNAAAAGGHAEVVQLLLHHSMSVGQITTGHSDNWIPSHRGRQEVAAVLLKQLCFIDPAAVEGAVQELQQPEAAAAACGSSWLAETMCLAKERQQLDQQRRSLAAERAALQQLCVAVAGMARSVAGERQAMQQLAIDVAKMQRSMPAGGVKAANEPAASGNAATVAGDQMSWWSPPGHLHAVRCSMQV